MPSTMFSSEFVAFVTDVEPRLRRALIATWGPDLGRDATAEALVYAWRHWGRVKALENPAGYLYRVGRNSVKPPKPSRVLHSVNSWSEPWVEPGLEAGLGTLSEGQRITVVLHHSFGWTYEEIAQVMSIGVSTVRNHLGRGMAKLREALEVKVDD